uniref:CRISP/Allergen/PR-1 n=1 Tax=Trittame loki TaxID=1295018 RepID=CRVP_TRILK|nr:RecName: Full=CRISP/Allergen/PR-1; Short=Cap-1; Flags: Precursor [Trittame loki]
MHFQVILMMMWLWLEAEGGTCPTLYKRYSKHHTYCLHPNSTCKILTRGVSSGDKEIILREHNKLRSRVATGKETKYSLPKASDMMQLVWDDELASVAQKHADQCVFEHDCNDCRNVQNFGVGQNLHLRTSSAKFSDITWAGAVNGWYDEVKDFNKRQISGFIDGKGPPQTGHFTQAVWATSWRVGCGRSMFKDGNTFKDLYTCNYGPGGNMKNAIIYTKGKPCSGCPLNSCCGKACGGISYDGLCKMSGNTAPQYSPPKGFAFRCTFNGESDCATTTSGAKKWKTIKTLSGSFIGIVLNPGESSTLSFTVPFGVSDGSMCVESYYRKGPQVAGQVAAGNAVEKFGDPADPSFDYSTPLKESTDFMQFGVTLGWNTKTTLSVVFSVPPGTAPQYLEMKDISVRKGEC